MNIDQHLLRAETQRRAGLGADIVHAVAIAERRKARRGRVRTPGAID